MRALVACSICNHTALAGSRVAVSLAAIEIGASPFAIGLLLSFYGLLPMFLSVPCGRWIDRIGMRTPMLAGSGLLVFGIVVPFLAWDIGALYLASVTIGVAFMAFQLAIQKAAGVIGGEPARTANFSLLALGFSVSGFIGPALSGVAIDLAGHRAVFGLLALAPLAAWVALRRYPFALHLPHEAVPEPGPDAPTRVLDLLGTAELRRLYLSVALLSSAWDVHQFLVPLYGAGAGLSASQIGLVLSAFALATFVVRLALPAISRRVAEWPLILAAMGMATVVYLLYPFFAAPLPMTALSFALGLGLGVSQPMVMVVLHRVSPPERIGEAAGLRLTMVNGTQTFLPVSFGAFGSAFGVASIFWGMAALVGGGAWYAGRDLRAQRRRERGALRRDPSERGDDGESR
ncbi:MAG: MFS transporter [Burkholderiaceae bacterium]|nr:MFS transporter [Burkholderiaceae bacterium]